MPRRPQLRKRVSERRELRACPQQRQARSSGLAAMPLVAALGTCIVVGWSLPGQPRGLKPLHCRLGRLKRLQGGVKAGSGGNERSA